VRIVALRDRLAFYLCDACGTQGAFSVSDQHSDNPRSE
jgi:hypothetical protein